METLADKLLAMLDNEKSVKEDFEDANEWYEVKSKQVEDSDGLLTDYTWYTDNQTKHIFMFGDRDIYTPDPEYADWEVEIDPENPNKSFEVAQEWFDNYDGFAEENYLDEYDSADEDALSGPLDLRKPKVDEVISAGYEDSDKTINVYNPNIKVCNNGQIGKIKNKPNPEYDEYNNIEVGRPSFVGESIRGHAPSNLGKSVYENYIGNRRYSNETKKK